MITPFDRSFTPRTCGLYKDGFPAVTDKDNGATHYIMDKAGENASPAIYQGLYMYNAEHAANETGWIYQGDSDE